MMSPIASMRTQMAAAHDLGGEVEGVELPRGRIGIITRSAPLAREVGRQMPSFGLGASKVACLGGAGEGAANHLSLLKMFNEHWGTDAVLLLGAIDPAEEEDCIAWLARYMKKPVIGFIDAADPAHAQALRLRACGVRMAGDCESVGRLVASLVAPAWLPFD